MGAIPVGDQTRVEAAAADGRRQENRAATEAENGRLKCRVAHALRSATVGRHAHT